MITLEEMESLRRPPPPSRFLLQVLRIGALTRELVEEALAPTGLTANAVELLRLLANRPGSSEADLARHLRVHRQSLTPGLRALASTTLIERSRSPDDRRSLVWRATPAGLKKLRTAHDAIARLERILLDDLPEEQQSQLLERFGVFATAVRSEEDRRFWKTLRFC